MNETATAHLIERAEAIIPANDATGHNVGAVVQLQIFLDDIWPKWFGHPLIGSDE